MKRRSLAWIFAFASLLSPLGAEIEYRGVNLSAAEFGYFGPTSPDNQVPGTYGTDYLYADESDFDYFRGVGMNTFRIPFRWERIQQSLNGTLDTSELSRLTSVVDHVTGLGANVILDVHNYARYLTPTETLVLGTPTMDAAFANLWSRLGTEFGNRDGVIFGLMNEPFDVGSIDLASERVVNFSNLALGAIRDTGANNLVLVQGNGYSGAHSWEQDWYGTPNSSAMKNIVDPGNNFAFEVHQYVDNNPGFESDYSGTTSQVESATIGAEKLAGFTDWLRTNGYRGFLGEYGTPDSDLGVEAMFNGIEFVEENADVWEGWALWAGGPWWDDPDGTDRYTLSVNPLADGSMAPQLAALSPFLTPVPEPQTWILVALAAAVLVAHRKIGKRASRHRQWTTMR